MNRQQQQRKQYLNGNHWPLVSGLASGNLTDLVKDGDRRDISTVPSNARFNSIKIGTCDKENNLFSNNGDSVYAEIQRLQNELRDSQSEIIELKKEKEKTSYLLRLEINKEKKNQKLESDLQESLDREKKKDELLNEQAQKIKRLEQNLSTTKHDNNNKNRTQSFDNKELKILEQKNKFITLERDHLLELLKCYREEVENYDSNSEINKKALFEKHDKVLMNLLGNLRNENKQLNAGFQAFQKEVEKEKMHSKLIKEKFNKIEEENKILKNKVSQKTFDSNNTKGVDYDVNITKVLVMKNNPSMPKLGGSVDLELKEVHQTLLKSKDLKHERLKQVFMEKFKKFREAIFILFGYRIEVRQLDNDTEHYRLQSIYCESDNDYLLFEWTSLGMSLLKTDFSQEIEQKLQAYLVQCNSIPGFLSSITLDLFSQKTFHG